MKFQAIEIPVNKHQTRRKTTVKIAPVIALAILIVTIVPVYYPLLKFTQKYNIFPSFYSFVSFRKIVSHPPQNSTQNDLVNSTNTTAQNLANSTTTAQNGTENSSKVSDQQQFSKAPDTPIIIEKVHYSTNYTDNSSVSQQNSTNGMENSSTISQQQQYSTNVTEKSSSISQQQYSANDTGKSSIISQPQQYSTNDTKNSSNFSQQQHSTNDVEKLATISQPQQYSTNHTEKSSNTSNHARKDEEKPSAIEYLADQNPKMIFEVTSSIPPPTTGTPIIPNHLVSTQTSPSDQEQYPKKVGEGPSTIKTLEGPTGQSHWPSPSDRDSVVIQQNPSNDSVAKKIETRAQESERSCDLFSGEWVWNPEAPYYSNKTCLAIQEHQNCMKFERPDTDYMKWRWKPDGCDLPIFDPVQFLGLMRGKSMAFIGDSVARNHLQSLICLISKIESEYPIEVSNSTELQTKIYQYKKYNFTLSIFWSPYLVRTTKTDPNDTANTRPFNLFLDEPNPEWASHIEPYDYLIISAGHWFFRPSMFYEQRRLVGCLYCPNTNITHHAMPYGYQKAFRTTFKTINTLKGFKGLTFLRSFAPSHFEKGAWNKGGVCRRTRPFRKNETNLDTYNLEAYMVQVKEIEKAVREGRERGLRFMLVDVTRAMLMRPDGHPSTYGHLPNAKVSLVNDCVHWCLPGPIDTWNDFLLQMMKMERT